MSAHEVLPLASDACIAELILAIKRMESVACLNIVEDTVIHLLELKRVPCTQEDNVGVVLPFGPRYCFTTNHT